MIASRIGAVRTVVRSVGGRRNMSYQLTNFKPPTMNDLPTPSGSWKIAHAQKQHKYNMWLAGSAIFCAATVMTARVTGLINIQWGPAYKD
ncbi:Deltamethrin resistance protein prag01 [Trinorchestia longiramus]|nr:Deltamethrin resistance protein prag01 [Trinorchestia longiramus]